MHDSSMLYPLSAARTAEADLDVAPDAVRTVKNTRMHDSSMHDSPPQPWCSVSACSAPLVRLPACLFYSARRRRADADAVGGFKSGENLEKAQHEPVLEISCSS